MTKEEFEKEYELARRRCDEEDSLYWSGYSPLRRLVRPGPARERPSSASVLGSGTAVGETRSACSDVELFFGIGANIGGDEPIISSTRDA